MAVAAAAVAAVTGHALYAFPAARPVRPSVHAVAPAPGCAGPGWHRARPCPLQVKGAGRPALAELGIGEPSPAPKLPLIPEEPHRTCSDPDTGLPAASRAWLPLPTLAPFLVLSPAWLISRTPHQGACQGHVLPRLRQLPGECLSLRRAATSHL